MKLHGEGLASAFAVVAFCASAAPLRIRLPEGPMVALAENVFAEPGLDTVQGAALLREHAAAVANVRRFFGEPHVPLTLFCRTAACKRALGGPTDASVNGYMGFARDGVPTDVGYVVRPVVVVTSGSTDTVRLLTHELVHAEMKAYAPYDALPTWFNEGTASWVAGNPSCSGVPPVSDFDVTTLDTKAKWQEFIARPGVTLKVYCRARDEVGFWLERFSEPAQAGAAIKSVLVAAAAGEPFRLPAGR